MELCVDITLEEFMPNITKIIEIAIKGGYKWRGEDIKNYSIDNPLDITLLKTQNGEEWRETMNLFELLLDPDFYRALGKELGWGLETFCPFRHGGGDTENCEIYIDEAEEKHRELIHLIWEHGFDKGVEEWSGEILKQQKL